MNTPEWESTHPSAERTVFPGVRANGFSIAGLVFAITTAGSAFGASVLALALPLVCALVFSGIGFVRSRDRNGKSDLLARVGLALPLGVLALQGILHVAVP
ncbi:hypothetical protein [Paramicrobacterium fandaimingii]|uniref:hypothetical protein n=1 Tax=Paramicrobacterium fandaimingii TaxID=2708079 RepID=UPI00141DE12F|nr:hypothetical protein [Microbacterium fandaimingii]